MSGDKLLVGFCAASLSAAALILAALPLRAMFQSRTPRKVFCLLWDAALARLMIPTALPSPLSVWRWLPAFSPARTTGAGYTAAPGLAAPVTEAVTESRAVTSGSAVFPPGWFSDGSTVLTAMWLAAVLALAVWFLRGHLRFRRICSDSLPCEDAFVRDWLAAPRLRRRIRVRISDRIAAPLTYGVLRPVILLPSAMDWPDRAALCCILEHETHHIRRFDALRKALLAAALCLHWFNPLVWVLYVLSNRDMELACDEAVTAQGADRAGYAHTLLSMEEQRGRWDLSGSHFSQNALEERIRSIMKHKKTSIAALIAVLVVMSIATTVFASAAPEGKSKTDSIHDHAQAVENDVMILSQGGEDGADLYSVDGGRTWMSPEDYRDQYGGANWQVEWWTAEEYALWLEEEKQALQSIIGERGYTSGEGWFTWDQKRVDEAIALYESILEDIQNGALYSKSITDKNGDVVEDVALGSGTLAVTDVFTLDEQDVTAPRPVDEAALLEELRPFGIGGDADQMTYKGQPVRCFVDGVPVGDSGYSIQYVYRNPDGAVDVHTLRSVLRHPDGFYDPMGELIGVAVEGDENFDWDLLDSVLSSGGLTQAETEITDVEAGAGALLERYVPFGLNYEIITKQGEPQLCMRWREKQVHSLYDTQTEMWFANNLHGTELDNGAVDLETVYRGGQLCGLQESQPPHEVLHGVEAAAVSGSGTKDGQTFEEIFAQYQPYGLVYSPRESGMGSLTWNGRAVRSFADLKPDGGAFSYQDPVAQSGLRVYTQYDADGNLTGLRAE